MSGEFDEFRRQMPVARQWAYFDHAAVAPLTAAARDALVGWADAACLSGDTVWPEWAARVEEVRRTLAATIGAGPDEIALVPNTTSGIHLVAEGFPWNVGDNVVTPANEFPSNRFPWLNLASRQVETRLVPAAEGRLDAERLLAACDGRTRLIAVSWIGYASGWKLDLPSLVERAHAQGILVLLDAIQGLGVFPLDVRQTPIDFLAADGHKWLLGPEGAGVFFLRREHLDLLRPLGVGWNSVVQAHDFSRAEFALRPAAARYEGGSQNMAGVAALGASLDLLVRHGLTCSHSPLAERVLELVNLAADGLRRLGAEVFGPPPGPFQSGILPFGLPGQDPAEVRRRCLRAGVALSCRGGHLRLSPHAYNNQQDLERLLDALVGR